MRDRRLCFEFSSDTVLGNGDFLNVYSLSEKELLYYEKLDFQFEDNVTSDEPESICELDPGVFLAVVNVTLSDGTKKVRLYRTEVPYQYEVEVKVQVGEDKPSVSRKTVLRGEAFEADYPEKEGYRIASVKIDKKEIDLEKYQGKYTLKSVQGHIRFLSFMKRNSQCGRSYCLFVSEWYFCQRALSFT